MNTSETVAKLTGAGMQNSYLMTYLPLPFKQDQA
jgi:hypothetical protein